MQEYTGLIFLALPLILLWLAFSRTRRQQRALTQAQAEARPGAWVMTTSGLHGQVVEATDGDPTVLLEIAPGVRTRWARLAVAEVFDDDPVTRHARARAAATEVPAATAAPDPDDKTLT